MSRDELLTSFSFDESARSGGSHAVAASIASYYGSTPGIGGVIILVAPDRSGVQVVAGGTESALRAAISSAASAGSFPVWQQAPAEDTSELDRQLLPETVRAATDGAGVLRIDIGSVVRNGRPTATVLWIDVGSGAADEQARRQVLDLLEAAAERDEAQAASDAIAEAERTAAAAAAAAAAPQVDPLEAIVDAETFEAAFDDYDADEAILVLLDIDEFEAIAADRTPGDIDRIVEEIALRLTSNCRDTDLIAQLDDHRFAILLGDANRNAGMAIVKRVHDRVAEPIATGECDTVVSLTVAFAHQDGLLDLEDLLDSAERAVANSRRSGPGRLVLAS